MTISVVTKSVDETYALGKSIGALLKGGELFELHSDIGGGKTSFMKGLAEGMGCSETVQSPTFVVSAVYKGADDKELHHYDFYRLADPGVMGDQLQESLDDPKVVTAVEWSDVVRGVLTKPMVVISVHKLDDENARQLDITLPEKYEYLKKALPKQSEV
jgi:tRNA threonylcarbamoyladenosine biosynthesis protein TsaE